MTDPHYIMMLFQIRFTRSDSDTEDDILSVYSTDIRGIVRVVMKPGDFVRTANESYMQATRVEMFISTVMRSLEHDVDPFQYVQFLSAMSPSVMYSVPDLCDPMVRSRLVSSIHQVLQMDVERIEYP